MMLVTAAIEGTGSSPKCLAQLRAASWTGSNGSESDIARYYSEWARRHLTWPAMQAHNVSLRRTLRLEDRRFGVGAPDVLERVDHLALGRVDPGAVDQQWHEVGLA